MLLNSPLIRTQGVHGLIAWLPTAIVSLVLGICPRCCHATEGGVTSGVAQARQITIPECDRVFYALYVHFMYLNDVPHIAPLFRKVSPDPMPEREDTHDRIAAQVRSFTIPEKCRFAVLFLLAFDLDGENAETFGDTYLGSDKQKVAAKLDEVTDKEWIYLSKSRRVPVHDKVEFIKRQITLWKR